MNVEDLSAPLARHAAQYPSDALDDATISHLQANLLDVIGVTLGGVHAAGLPGLREFLRQTSSAGRGVLFGTADRLSAPAAAFANAAAAHALEFDDAFDAGGGMHAGPVVHSVALAVADELGGVPGTEYLGAVAVGLDVAVRLAAAPTVDFGWHRASVFSVFGATVTAGRLIGLDAPAMRHALGLALSQASGSRQSIRDGSLSTRLHTGFAARNAITAAFLARSGFTGAAQIFDGPDGFIALFQRGEYRRELVLDGLGEHLQSSRISTKPFPGGLPTHALLEAALELRTELGGAGIEEVVVHAPAGARRPGRRGVPDHLRGDLQPPVLHRARARDRQRADRRVRRAPRGAGAGSSDVRADPHRRGREREHAWRDRGPRPWRPDASPGGGRGIGRAVQPAFRARAAGQALVAV